jgi:hypothetical protein
MGRDNQPRHRQKARDLRRRAAIRQPYKRILIVCEGEKTEPSYLNEIRAELRLSTAHVQVQAGRFGTQPQQLVEFARHLFRKGDRSLGIEPGVFDHIYLVFDRDDHATYHQALAMASDLDKRLLNDEHRQVRVEAIASVPCFEIWLLLHFENISAPIHRDDVVERLNTHIPGYTKGQGGHWRATKKYLAIAVARATARAEATTAHDGYETFTDMHRLVHELVHLKD